jgi:hypothetical protein
MPNNKPLAVSEQDIVEMIMFPIINEACRVLADFDPQNCFLNIQKSIETPTPKVGVCLGMCGFIPSHSPTFLRA